MANPISSPTERILALEQDYINLNRHAPKNLFHLFPQTIRIEILTYTNVQNAINLSNPDHLNANANLRYLAPDLKDVSRADDKVKVNRMNHAEWTLFSDSTSGIRFNVFRNFILRNSPLITSLKISDEIVGTSSDLVPPQIVTAADILDLVALCVNLSRLELSNGLEQNLVEPIRPADMSRFVTIPFQNLKDLRFDVLSVDIPRLVAGAFLQDLSILTLSGCSVTNSEFQILVNSKMVINLTQLKVSGSNLKDNVSTLFQSRVPLLQDIDLSGSQISDLSGFPALKMSNILPSLIALKVFCSRVTVDHVNSILFPGIKVDFTTSPRD